ncbi:gliding motility-associated C-terminal domain-containing protein [Marivirga sp. S37H4]|uniref:Gliding motility-associated C-terminal domain-containing protein n=1 Tax=Marivirga aurantiaca TaxID=2802615 RepID=A0A934WWH5_9BACT|nr:Ig-like domain-containing protein [Marivirga aurantiaca]MBK6264368.1 gliding motility-associated C-terminal domain-containing protein [Marivirga aurantiaca]
MRSELLDNIQKNKQDYNKEGSLRLFAHRLALIAFFSLTPVSFIFAQYEYDVSKAVYNGDAERFFIGTQEATPYTMAFNNDGTKMFVTGSSRFIYEYNLSVGYDVSTATYAGDGERFNLATWINSPRTLRFNGTGMKMYVLDYGNEDITEFDLTVAYDVSTASYSQEFDTAPHSIYPFSFTFSTDGSKMYVVEFANETIIEYTLSTNFDISTAGHSFTKSISAQEPFPYSIRFTPDGTKMYVTGQRYDAISQFSLSTAFDLSTATYDGNAERFSILAQESQATSMNFNSDGSKLFVLGLNGKDVNEYLLINFAPEIGGTVAGQSVNDNELISPFSTVTIADANRDQVSATIELDNYSKGVLTGTGLSGSGPYTLSSATVANLQAGLRALVFNPTDGRVTFENTETTNFSLTVSDGTLSDVDNITNVVSTSATLFLSSIEVSGNPVSTANTVDFIISFNGAVTGVDLSDFTLDNSAGVSANLASISGSGDTYTVTVDNITGHGILSIDLKDSGTGIASGGTPISGGFTNGAYHEVGDAFDVSKAIFDGDEDRFSVAALGSEPTSFAFNNDGTKMFVLEASGDDINEYTLSTAFDVSTAIYAGDAERFSIAAQEIFPASFAFNNDGTKMFVLGVSGKDINEYTLSTAFDVSIAAYAGDGEQFNVSIQETSPYSLVFNNDGTKMFVLGVSGKDINEYTLSTAFDVSTAVYAGDVERFSVSAQESSPLSLAFNNSGTKMFVMGADGDDINEYDLATAFDVSTAVYAGDGEQFNVSIQETSPYSLVFNNDGTKMFVMGQSGRDINEYSLAAPVVTGAVANQAVNDNATISPFGAITVADPNGDNVSATITLDDDTKGVLTGTGLTGTGPYTLASTDAASLQAALRALEFNPTDSRVAPGSTETTTFTLLTSDGIFDDIDSRTTVVSSPIAPTIVWSSLASSPTNAFSITATFSEPVTGFTIDDLTVGNGTASNFVATSSSVYTATITPIADGTVTVDAAAGVAQDAGGVDNIAASQFSITADVTVPTITISSSVADPTNDAFIATFTFSEDVTGFEVDDITVGNGTASDFASTSASVYTALITPTADGTVTVDVAADVAQDAATNGNTAATQFSIEFDITAPIVSITSAAANPTNGAFTATFTFSEEVTGFEIGDITVGNGTASDFASTSASVYTVLITPTTDGSVTIDVAADVAQDAATNGNTAAAQFSIEFDITAPIVSITSAAANPTNGAFTATFTFSEEVTGFEIGDITVGNGTASDFASTSASVYTVLITPTAGGTVTIDVAANVAQDAATNGNTAATQFSIEADLTAPTIAITSPATDLANGAFTATFTFSENVTDFEVGDISVGNGTASDFVSTSASVYTALITPTTDGTVTVDVAASVAQDAATNGNTAAAQFSIEFDITAPIVSITSTAAGPTNTAFMATFTFSENVTGFEVGDISVGNGTASDFMANSALEYTALVTPTADGTTTIDVAADVVQDAATNGNTAAAQFSIEFDITAPIVSITSTAAGPTNTAFMATFTFSENVTGFEVGDISVGNGTASDFMANSALEYTALVTPTADGTTTIDVAANVAQDAATNGNTAATQFSIEADLTAPTLAITSPATDPTNGAFMATFTFSENVTGFEVDDISVGNGTASDFTTTNASEYTALITPATDGTVNIDVAANVAQDAATNGNTVAAQFSIDYDGSVAEIICQNITIQLDANGIANIEASQIDNGSSDNYGIASMALDITTFDCNNIGDNEVVLTVTDVNGNTGTCLAVVTVEDVTPPEVIVRDITLPLAPNGQASITIDDIDNGSNDNCGIASRILDVSAFDTPTTASTMVILTVTDFSGNTASAPATITFGKVAQAILFEPLADKKVGADPVTLQATGGESGLPVTFSITTEPATGVASIIDNMIIIEGPGMVTVTANQAGNDVFLPAEEVSQTFEIQSNELFLPTLFSPNNDQVNDSFVIRGGGNIATIELKIFDRDNNLVFNSNSLTDLFQMGWNGNEQPQGVYIWVVKGSFTDGAPVLINGKNTGIIRLIR